jgi:regulator of nucleoside diphosphate kinase
MLGWPDEHSGYHHSLRGQSERDPAARRQQFGRVRFCRRLSLLTPDSRDCIGVRRSERNTVFVNPQENIMTALPPIVVSTRDRDRLFTLLDNFRGDSDVVDLLYEELARARIVDDNELPEGVVTLGCRIRFRNEDSGKEHERVLVMPREVTADGEAISILTPAGAALLGLSAGDEIRWPHGDGHLRLRLLTVARD